MRTTLLLTLIVLAGCSRAAPVPPLATAFPDKPLVTAPDWLATNTLDYERNLGLAHLGHGGDIDHQWSVRAVLVSAPAPALQAAGLPLPGEPGRTITPIALTGSEIFDGICLGGSKDDLGRCSNVQVEQRTYVADYRMNPGQAADPVTNILNLGHWFDLTISQQGDQRVVSAVRARITRLIATTKGTFDLPGWDLRLPVEEPQVALGDATALDSAVPLGDAPVMIALPITWQLVRTTAQARCWAILHDETTTPISTLPPQEGQVLVVMLQRVVPPTVAKQP